MLSKHSSLISLLLVIGVHVGVLAAVVMSKPDPAPIEIVQPTIQGVIVMAPREQVVVPPPEPTPPPPPEKKPEPKPQPKPKPIPKAPPSERAVKAPEPEPTPPAPVEPPPPAQPQPPAPAPEPAPIIPPRAEAGQLSNPAPPYPTLSRRLREEGTVVLDILIRADGSVGEIKLKTSSGFKRLDDAAIHAVKRWRYKPATQGGKAIDFWYELPLEFNLH
jgi:protein TonB